MWLSLALRTAITQAGPAAGLVGDVVLEVGLGGGSSAGGGGASRVPDLGQVPQFAAGVMPGGLEPVITAPGGDRVHRECQVPLPGNPGGEPPGSVPARRPVPAAGGDGESWAVPAGRAGRIRRAGSAGRPGFLLVARPFSAVSGGGPGAAVPDRVAVLVGDGQAPGGRGVGGGGAGQVPGQPRVDRAQPEPV